MTAGEEQGKGGQSEIVSATQIRCLEGIGYLGAIMIGVAGFTQEEVLQLFNVAGLVFGLIAVVRLLTLNLHRRRIQAPLEEQENLPQSVGKPKSGEAGEPHLPPAG